MEDNRYPREIIPEDEDDGTIQENVEELANKVVGHRIISAEIKDDVKALLPDPRWCVPSTDKGLVLTLDNGHQVVLANTSDCCAFTEIETFFLHPDSINHVILGVGTTDGVTVWHIYADFGDIMTLAVNWSCGNPFFYGYGFDIEVVELKE